MDRDGELLVLADRATFADTLRTLRATATVTHVLRPIVIVSGADPAVLRRFEGVREVVTDDLSAAARHDLEPEARTFVDAWRRRSAPRDRRGDGLAWDAPGFLPPDPPREDQV